MAIAWVVILNIVRKAAWGVVLVCGKRTGDCFQSMQISKESLRWTTPPVAAKTAKSSEGTVINIWLWALSWTWMWASKFKYINKCQQDDMGKLFSATPSAFKLSNLDAGRSALAQVPCLSARSGMITLKIFSIYNEFRKKNLARAHYRKLIYQPKLEEIRAPCVSPVLDIQNLKWSVLELWWRGCEAEVMQQFDGTCIWFGLELTAKEKTNKWNVSGLDLR
jgi:hypothetical protein